MNDGGASELSNSVQGSTVVGLWHFNTPPAELTSVDPPEDIHTVGLWHFNEVVDDTSTVTDSSSYGNDGTCYSNGVVVSTLGTTAGMFGNCIEFDGDDHVEVPDDGSLDFGTNDFTLEAWIKTQTNDANYTSIIRKGLSGTYPLYNITVKNGYFTTSIEDDAANTVDSQSTAYIADNRWYHVASVFDRSNDVIKRYVDGTFISDVDISAITGSVSNTDDLYLGSNGSTPYLNGLIDEVRISSGALSATTICADAGGAVDSSALGNHGKLTVATQTYTTSMSGFGNCLDFNGNSDYVEISTYTANADSLNITGAITLEGWVKTQSIASQGIIAKWQWTAGSWRSYFLFLNADNRLRCILSSDGINDSVTAYSDSAVQTNVWTYTAVVWDGSKLNMYLNGQLNGTPVSYTSGIFAGPAIVEIGSQNNGGSSYFDGLIDEVRISLGAISAAQIAADAGTYVADATVNGNWGIVISTAGTSAGLSMWTDSGKFSKATTYDGTNDCVQIDTTTTLNFGGDSSWESWVKTTSSNDEVLMMKYENGNNFYGIRIDNGIVKSSAAVAAASVWNVTGTKAINDNAFHHIAVSRESSVASRIYVDGIEDASGADTGADISLGAGKLYLGRDGNPAAAGWFTGTIDEVRISTAVYAEQEIRRDALGLCYDSGDYVSDVLDTGKNGTIYETISASSSTPVSTTLNFYVRVSSCSPYQWSSWFGPYGSGSGLGDVTNYRYCQFKATFTTTDTIYSAVVEDCTIEYSTNTASPPNLTTPSDAVWLSSARPVFQWDFVDSESDTQTGYDLELSTKIDFSIIYHSSNSASTEPKYQPDSDIENDIYWWRCKTKESGGDLWSAWSSTYQVKVDTIAPVGMTISWIRADNENQITIEGTGTDAGSGLHADAWWFEETTGNPGATSSSVWESTSVYTDSGLSRNTQYTYKVKLRDAIGNESAYSTAIIKKTQPCVWQEKTTTRTGPNAFGFDGDGVWTWKVPVNGGSLVTITAYTQYNSDYGGAAKPKFTLYNYGVNSSAQMTVGADTWKKLTVSGEPTEKGVLFLKVEGFSTEVDAKYFVDDIQINQ